MTVLSSWVPPCPTPNTYRTASGAPGKEYWQQRADYDIKAELDDDNRRIIGSETITFFNQSPDDLKYIWMQLDQNLFKNDGIAARSRTGTVNQKGMNVDQLQELNSARGANLDPKIEYGYKITAVKDKAGKALPFTINGTMMRIDLPARHENRHCVRVQRGLELLISPNTMAAAATNISRKTVMPTISSRTGSHAWPRTTTSMAGTINSSWARASLH
jgi:hypothetical protein